MQHGASEQRDEARVSIYIFLKDNVLESKIENTEPEQKQENIPGIGLQNLRRQLELLYPKKHELRITEVEEHFVVEAYSATDLTVGNKDWAIGRQYRAELQAMIAKL